MLRDVNPHCVLAFTQLFGGEDDVSFGSGDLTQAQVDAVVSPANSFGIMDGGIDRYYRNTFGLRVENTLRGLIERRYPEGELPIGEALLVPTGHPRIPRMVAAPTMRTPGRIVGTDNVRRAMLAALRTASAAANPPIERLGCPSMGTGVGRMDPFDAVEQMLDAWRSFRAERAGTVKSSQSLSSLAVADDATPSLPHVRDSDDQS
ncbi:macro domain-containing protein [Plesiocystis pacifica]|uniref:macro domain-containing protein n=1 Tax=Plesiocystis pacifica TaxID=191768 RepID=UPI001E4E2AA0|nr:macro domain-containing protein [Plesiocystis pacifica]